MNNKFKYSVIFMAFLGLSVSINAEESQVQYFYKKILDNGSASGSSTSPATDPSENTVIPEKDQANIILSKSAVNMVSLKNGVESSDFITVTNKTTKTIYLPKPPSLSIAGAVLSSSCSSIPSMGSCQIDMKYVPAQTGVFEETISVFGKAISVSASVETPAEASYDNIAITFDGVAAPDELTVSNMGSPSFIRIENISDKPVTPPSYDIMPSGETTWTVEGNCESQGVILPGQSCELKIYGQNPDNQDKAYQGRLVLSTASGSLKSFKLHYVNEKSGYTPGAQDEFIIQKQGSTDPVIADSVEFEAYREVKLSRNYNIRNITDKKLTLTGFSVDTGVLPSFYHIQTPGCFNGSNMAPGATCPVAFSFDSMVGSMESDSPIHVNFAGNSFPLNVVIYDPAKETPNVVAADEQGKETSLLDFGSLAPASAPVLKTVVFKNSATRSVQVPALSLTGDEGFSIVTSDCSGYLKPAGVTGDSCSATVVFDGSGKTLGKYTKNLTFAQKTVSLEAVISNSTATSDDIAVSLANSVINQDGSYSLNFSDAFYGEPTVNEATVFFKNISSKLLAMPAIDPTKTTMGNGFLISANTCEGQTGLAPQESCGITVKYNNSGQNIQNSVFSMLYMGKEFTINQNVLDIENNFNGFIADKTTGQKINQLNFPYRLISSPGQSSIDVAIVNSSTKFSRIPSLNVTGNGFSISNRCSGNAVASGQSCIETIVFDSTSKTEGTYSGQLEIAGTGQSIPLSINVLGDQPRNNEFSAEIIIYNNISSTNLVVPMKTTEDSLTINPPENNTNSFSGRISITNNSPYARSIKAPAISLESDGMFEMSNVNYAGMCKELSGTINTIAPGGSCSYHFKVNASSLSKTLLDYQIFTGKFYLGGKTVTINQPIHNFGVLPGNFQIFDASGQAVSSFDFADTRPSLSSGIISKTYTYKNVSSVSKIAPITIVPYSNNLDDRILIGGNTCSGIIASNASCEVTLRASASTTRYDQTLNYGDVDISGVKIPAKMVLTTVPIQEGQVVVGSGQSNTPASFVPLSGSWPNYTLQLPDEYYNGPASVAVTKDIIIKPTGAAVAIGTDVSKTEDTGGISVDMTSTYTRWPATGRTCSSTAPCGISFTNNPAGVTPGVKTLKMRLGNINITITKNVIDATYSNANLELNTQADGMGQKVSQVTLLNDIIYTTSASKTFYLVNKGSSPVYMASPYDFEKTSDTSISLYSACRGTVLLPGNSCSMTVEHNLKSTTPYGTYTSYLTGLNQTVRFDSTLIDPTPVAGDLQAVSATGIVSGYSLVDLGTITVAKASSKSVSYTISLKNISTHKLTLNSTSATFNTYPGIIKSASGWGFGFFGKDNGYTFSPGSSATVTLSGWKVSGSETPGVKEISMIYNGVEVLRVRFTLVVT